MTKSILLVEDEPLLVMVLEELLVELERRYASRLMFRGDPTYHHEKFIITDANTNAELKS